MALTAAIDHNGVAINVGDTVKLQGVVSKVDITDNHFGEIYITISYPNTGINGIPNPEVAGFSPNIIGGEIHGPKGAQIIQVMSTALTH